LASFGDLDDGSDELSHEPIQFEQRWPEMVDKVDQKALDVRAIVILIRHNHDAAVSQFANVLIFGAYLNPENFNQILNLWILHYLLVASLSDIQEFTSQRKDSILVATDNLDSSKCQTFG